MTPVEIQKVQITNFIAGLNTRDNPRVLKPLALDESTAEAADIMNMEITSEGSLITSPGFIKVAEIPDVVGGFKYASAYTKTAQDRYIVAAHTNKFYSLSIGTTVFNELGSYGTEAENFAAVEAPDFNDNGVVKLYITNTDVTNELQVFDGTTLTSIPGAPKGGQAITVFMGRLFIAIGATVYYSATDDFTQWGTDDGGGAINFDDTVVGFIVEGERIIVFVRSYNQGIQFQYDDQFVLSVPLKEPYQRKYGALSPGAISRINSDVFYLNEDSEAYQLGAEVINDSTGLPRPRTLSAKIDPSLKLTNQASSFKATAEYFDKQWWVAVPSGNSTYNDVVFKWNEDFNSWTKGFGYYPASFVKTKDENTKDALYFVSGVAPTLYKFNQDYLFDQQDYKRLWKSKRFTFGSSKIFKYFPFVDLTGSMYSNTEFFVKVDVDGNSQTFIVNSEQLLRGGSGNYIGDDNIGDALIGGESPETSAFTRYRAFIELPVQLREGYEMQITIFNSGANQPFLVDGLDIGYGYMNPDQIPDQNRVKEIVIN